MGKAWLAALIAMSIGLIAYFAVVRVVPNQVAVALAWANPIVGAAVASFLAPRNKFNVGAATAVLAIVLIGAGSYFAGRMGLGDFVGLEGTTIGIVLSLPLIVGASVVGALMGEWMSKRSADA
jgi:hypothetical protein